MKIGKINRQSIGISGFTSVLENYAGMPKELFVAGTLPEHRIKAVAIIGSRKPTNYGKQVTHQLAYGLAKQGIAIISGLAFGIDKIAHEAALEAGGTTIAIMANGLHRVYPVAHEALAEQIIKNGGAIISEQELGVDAHKYHFLARNRIVSGLADAVIVTEATHRSGTLSTVGHALDQNKEVFAVPGPITSLLSVGPNKLIQQGAHVALSVQDVLDIIAPETPRSQTQLSLGDTPLEVAIIRHIQQGVASADALINALSKESPAEILQTLTLMELKGTLRVSAGVLHLGS
ncbi:MAG: DNA-processing protein DprA [Candidatus Microsaccharimonas sp.]